MTRAFLLCFCTTVSNQKLDSDKGLGTRLFSEHCGVTFGTSRHAFLEIQTCLHFHRSPPSRRRRRSRSRSPVRRYGSGRSHYRGRSRSRSYSPPRRRDRRTRRRSRYVCSTKGPQLLLQKGGGTIDLWLPKEECGSGKSPHHGSVVLVN